MPNLDIEFELSGLKLKIKGQTEDVTGKVADLQRQIQNLMGTIATLAQNGAGALPAPPPEDHGKVINGQPAAQLPEATVQRLRQRKPSSRKGFPQGPRAEAMDFRHDAEKYGFPKQNWSTAQKAMWTIYMLAESGDTKEFSAGVIAAIYNKHFKSFGTIRPQNVLRDLGNEKGRSGAVNSDATQDPMKWYLLESGKSIAAVLVNEAKGTTAE